METQHETFAPEAPIQDAGLNPTPNGLAKAREHRRVEALTWEPNDSAARLTREVVLGSQTVQKGFHLSFARAQIACYQLLAFMPFIADEKKILGLEQVVDGMIGKLEKAADNASAHLDALIKADGLTLGAPDWSKPQTVQVNVFTPYANRFLRLMLRFDELIWRVETLYLNGSISPLDRTKLILDWKKLMYGLPRALQQLWIREKAAVRRIYAERSRESAARIANAAGRQVKRVRNDNVSQIGAAGTGESDGSSDVGAEDAAVDGDSAVSAAPEAAAA